MKNHTLYKFGAIVRKYRSIAGLSQEKLSELIECDKNTIGRIERGETDCRLSTVIRLAEGMNVSLSRLTKDLESFHIDQYAATIEYDFLRLFQYCRQLSPEQFNNICNTAHIYAKGNHKTAQYDGATPTSTFP